MNMPEKSWQATVCNTGWVYSIDEMSTRTGSAKLQDVLSLLSNILYNTCTCNAHALEAKRNMFPNAGQEQLVFPAIVSTFAVCFCCCVFTQDS